MLSYRVFGWRGVPPWTGRSTPRPISGSAKGSSAYARGQGVTQRVLAERLGVRQTFVSAYERGDRRLDVVELRAIAVALGGPALAVVAQLDALDAVLAAVGDNAS